MHSLCFCRNALLTSISSYYIRLNSGNPVGKKVWDWVWTLKAFQKGEQGTSPTTFGDAANVIKTNIEQVYGGEPSLDGT